MFIGKFHAYKNNFWIDFIKDHILNCKCGQKPLLHNCIILYINLLEKRIGSILIPASAMVNSPAF